MTDLPLCFSAKHVILFASHCIANGRNIKMGDIIQLIKDENYEMLVMFIIISLSIWLFRTFQKTYMERKHNDESLLREALVAYAEALNTLKICENVNYEKLYLLIRFLPNDIHKNYLDLLKKDDFSEIECIINKQIQRLKGMQIDKISEEVLGFNFIIRFFKRSSLYTNIFLPLSLTFAFWILIFFSYMHFDNVSKLNGILAFAFNVSAILNLLAMMISFYSLDILINKTGIWKKVSTWILVVISFSTLLLPMFDTLFNHTVYISITSIIFICVVFIFAAQIKSLAKKFDPKTSSHI